MGLRARPPDGEPREPARLDPDEPAATGVWGHPRDVEGETVRGQGVATLEASDIHDHQFVEMRVTVPRDAGPERQRRRPRGGRRACRGSSTRSRRPTTTSTRPSTRPSAGSPTTRSLLVGSARRRSRSASCGLMRLMAREHPTSTAKHLPEPPDDAGPALAYGLAHEGEDSDDTVLATLLDLVDRGFYDSKPATDRGREARPGDLEGVEAARTRASSSRTRQEVLALLRRAARGRDGPDERDEGPDPRARRTPGAAAGSR